MAASAPLKKKDRCARASGEFCPESVTKLKLDLELVTNLKGI